MEFDRNSNRLDAAKKNAVSRAALHPVGGIVGGTAGIEPASFKALPVLEMSHKVYGAISANTPSVAGWL